MTSTSPLQLLVLSDIHYASTDAEMAADQPQGQAHLGCELARRAIVDAQRRGGFDAVAILGDFLNDGTAAGSEKSLAIIAERITEAVGDAPLLILPGNHDGDTGRLMSAFGARAGLHVISRPGGQAYRFVVFADSYDSGDRCTRSDADRRMLAELPGDGPIIALQHNPLSPRIDTEYPFMHTNRDDIMADYSRAGVLLSLSGHYHRGQSLNHSGGVAYFTASAMSEAPFSYAMVTLSGREVTVEPRTLSLSDDSDPPLTDSHCHTEFAYCASNITAATAIDRSRMLNLAALCITEHAPQLYMSADDFWAGKHFSEPDCWLAGPGRMAKFRKHIETLRDGLVRVGLEVELDGRDRLTLRDEDRHWPDLLVGAVHWIKEDHAALSDSELASAFMHANEALMAHGVNIIAHPWRYFSRISRSAPTDLYPALADMLAATNTAAEINFHLNEPDPAFIAAAIERGVKISFGTDAHAIEEAGGLTAHLALLRQVAATDDVSQLLYQPARGK